MIKRFKFSTKTFLSTLILATLFLPIFNSAHANAVSIMTEITPGPRNVNLQDANLEFNAIAPVKFASFSYYRGDKVEDIFTAPVQIDKQKMRVEMTSLDPGITYFFTLSAMISTDETPYDYLGLVKTKGFPVVLTVVDDGQPLANRQLEIVPEQVMNVSENTTFTTDANGKLTVDLKTGKFTITDERANKRLDIKVEPAEILENNAVLPQQIEADFTNAEFIPAANDTENTDENKSDDNSLLVIILVPLLIIVCGLLIFIVRRVFKANKPTNTTPQANDTGDPFDYFEQHANSLPPRYNANPQIKSPPVNQRTQNPSGLNLEDQPEDMFEENQHRFDNLG